MVDEVKLDRSVPDRSLMKCLPMLEPIVKIMDEDSPDTVEAMAIYKATLLSVPKECIQREQCLSVDSDQLKMFQKAAKKHPAASYECGIAFEIAGQIDMVSFLLFFRVASAIFAFSHRR